ncbi:MAG: polyprenol monophosphomannose synthase [Deltaproteobacteria bacterium]|nr:polyprenol monophosphomannose synthase [Deltaproteobacteria bacterium]
MSNKAERILIISPTYHERENITPLVSGIMQTGLPLNILFVDDSSQDGTRSEILRMQKEWPDRVHLLPRPAKLGLGSAYVEGFLWGLERGFTYLIEMDADLSHAPEYLTSFLKEAAHSPVVVGSRYIAGGGTENWNKLRQFISKAGSWYARTVLGLNVQDLTGGYNLWHRDVLETIRPETLKSDGYVFQAELKYRALMAGFKLTEVPIIFCDRRAGHSKMSLRIVLEAIWKVILLRLQKQKLQQTGQDAQLIKKHREPESPYRAT